MLLPRFPVRHPLSGMQEGIALKVEVDLGESDSEDEPDQEIQVPSHKVKLFIGAGGEKIKFIQKKSKCRIQVRKCNCFVWTGPIRMCVCVWWGEVAWHGKWICMVLQIWCNPELKNIHVGYLKCGSLA